MRTPMKRTTPPKLYHLESYSDDDGVCHCVVIAKTVKEARQLASLEGTFWRNPKLSSCQVVPSNTVWV